MTYFSQKKEKLQYLRSILSGAIVKTVILSAAPAKTHMKEYISNSKVFDHTTCSVKRTCFTVALSLLQAGSRIGSQTAKL